MITTVLANVTVSDLDRARSWYVALFDAEPDVEPMPGLLEWHVASSGLQVWTEPDRAGRSGVTIEVDDLDAVSARLTEAGLEHDGPQPATSSRILPLADPDGNRVVLVGA